MTMQLLQVLTQPGGCVIPSIVTIIRQQLTGFKVGNLHPQQASFNNLSAFSPCLNTHFFSTLSALNGNHRIECSQATYLSSDEPMLTPLCQSNTQSKHMLNKPATFGFVDWSRSKKPFIILTHDSLDFRVSWENVQPYAKGHSCGPRSKKYDLEEDRPRIRNDSRIRFNGLLPVY